MLRLTLVTALIALANASVDTSLFPPESVVGYYGPTKTGAEGFTYQTAPAQPKRYAGHNPFAPIFLPVASDADLSDFSPIEHWGNLSPRRSLPADTFGLDSASPIAPKGCNITQAHMLFRHGSRYPSQAVSLYRFTTDVQEAGVTTFATKIQYAQGNGTLKASGPLEFLNSWSSKLGYEILNAFGRQQCYQLGVRARLAYGHLLNSYIEEDMVPVFRTGSQDRMVETMEAFAQGFFGRNSESQYNLELEIEAAGVNSTEAPQCPKGASYLEVTKAAASFEAKVFNSTAQRIQQHVQGVDLDYSDVYGMLGQCAYETLSIGYSDFCSLFTKDEFINYSYTYDLLFYYSFGPGTPSGAASGKGWVQELVARLSGQPITEYNSTTNSTLDSNPKTFPLNQSFYADATHDGYVSAILSTINFSFLNKTGALSYDERPSNLSFESSKLVPFNTNFEVQKMSCTQGDQIRFILNDAVIPIDGTFEGCEWDEDGLCGYDTVMNGLRERLEGIDYAEICL